MSHDIDRPSVSVQKTAALAAPADTNIEPYAKRFIKQVARGTLEVSVGQQVITFGVVGIITVLVQSYLGLITQALSWNSLLAVIAVLGITFLLIVLFNIIRAPFVLDKEQSQRILELTIRLSSAENQVKEGQQLLGAAESRLQQTEEKQPPERIDLRAKANLILRRVRVARTNRDRVIDEVDDGFLTTLVEFKNDPEAPFPVQAATVRANISFEEVNEGHRHEVSDNAWLKTSARTVTFRIGDAKELVIAIQGHDGVKAVRVREYKVRRMYQAFEFEFGDLTGSEYIVEVQIIAERPSQFLGKYRFKLTTRPELQIERLQAAPS